MNCKLSRSFGTDAREKLPIFIGTLERQQEYGWLINPERFAPEKIKDNETTILI
jgi:hypothetical protein